MQTSSPAVLVENVVCPIRADQRVIDSLKGRMTCPSAVLVIPADRNFDPRIDKVVPDFLSPIKERAVTINIITPVYARVRKLNVMIQW